MIYIIFGIVFVWLIILSVFLVCKEKKNKKLIEKLKTDIESNSKDIDLLQKHDTKLSQLLLEEYLSKFKVKDKVRLKDIETLKRLSVKIDNKNEDYTRWCSFLNLFATMRLFFEYSEDRIFTIKEIKDNAIYFDGDSYKNIPISPEWLEKVKENDEKQLTKNKK